MTGPLESRARWFEGAKLNWAENLLKHAGTESGKNRARLFE